jgi:hypothetical protein
MLPLRREVPVLLHPATVRRPRLGESPRALFDERREHRLKLFEPRAHEGRRVRAWRAASEDLLDVGAQAEPVDDDAPGG